MQGHNTRQMEGVEVKLNGNPPVVQQPQNARDIQHQHAEGRDDAPKSTKKKLSIVIVASIAFLLVVGGVMGSRSSADTRSAVSASAVSSPNVDCFKERLTLRRRRILQDEIPSDESFGSDAGTSMFEDDGPKDVINVGKSLVPRRRRIEQSEAIASNDGMFDMFTITTSTGVADILDKSDESRDGTISKKQLEVEDMDDDGVVEIIGGTILLKDSRPYLASIGRGESTDGEQAVHLCGGALISPRAVLTSAECFTNLANGDDAFLPRDWIDFNRYDLSSGLTGGVVRRTLSQTPDDFDDGSQAYVIRHPRWNFETEDNDFALIILGDPVDDITPVELNDNADIPADGDALETFGWGATDPIAVSDFPNLPQTVTLDVVSNNQCNKDWLTRDITTNMLCASNDGKGVNCFGDRGNPIIVDGEIGNPGVLVGVASFSVCNERLDRPDVFARVSAGLEWIKERVCEETSDLCETTTTTTRATAITTTAATTTMTTSKSGKGSKATKSSKSTKSTSKSAKSGAGESASAKDGVKCAIMHDNSSEISSSSDSRPSKSIKTSKSSKSAPCVCAEDEPWQLVEINSACFRGCDKGFGTGETEFASRKDCCAASDDEALCLLPDNFDSCPTGGQK